MTSKHFIVSASACQDILIAVTKNKVFSAISFNIIVTSVTVNPVITVAANECVCTADVILTEIAVYDSIFMVKVHFIII